MESTNLMSSRTGVAKGKNSHRLARVEKEIHEVVANYLIAGFRGNLSGIVSVSRVIASRDLRHAKVLVTILGEGVSRDEVISELQTYSRDFQSEINRRLRMKYCPKLTFLYDEGFENTLRVEAILRDLASVRKEDGGQ